jgi:DME family drug/metabolite transporter
MAPTLVYLAGFTAALFWGIAPVLSKRGFTYGGNPFLVTSIIVTTSVILFWSLLAASQGVTDVLPDISPAGYGIFLLAGFVGTAVGRINNYAGIDHVGTSINSAVIATQPVFATILAFLFLGEQVTIVQVAGIFAVVGGVVMLTFSRGGDVGGWRPRELLFPLAAAFAYATGSVIRRFGLQTTPALPLEAVALNETAALMGVVGYTVGAGYFRPDSIAARGYVYFVGAGLASATGLLAFFIGLNNGRVAIVTTLVATSTLFATVFSYLGLGDLEEVTRGIVAGAILVVVGVGVIVLG